MSLVQSINDLAGAPTMVEGQRRLNRAYNELVRAKKPTLAQKVNNVRNEFNGYLCETEVSDADPPGIFGPGGLVDQYISGDKPACYRQDQQIPGFLKAKIRRLSEDLQTTSPTVGEFLDPDLETGISGELDTSLPTLPNEAKFLIAAVVLLAVWNLTK